MHQDQLLVILRFCQGVVPRMNLIIMMSHQVITGYVLVRSAVYLPMNTTLKKILRIGPRKICPDLVFAASDVVCHKSFNF